MDGELEPVKVLSTLSKVLPDDLKTLNSPHVALAGLVHALHVNLGFRLTPSHDVDEGTEEERRLAGNKLPDGWGQQGRDLSLAYRHASSAMSFESGVSKIGGRVIVNALAVEDNKTKTLDLVIVDYFSASAFPFAVDEANYEAMFATPARLKDLISLWKSGIIGPLMPGLLKSSLDDDDAPPRTTGRGGYYPDPGGPFVGGRPEFPAGPSGLRLPSIGATDLDPLAGLGGTTGGRVPLGGGEGDGMILGPNHPLFRERFPLRGQEQDWGGMVPPGARFDPVGPGMPGMPMPGRPRGGQGGGRNFGDAMRPPGFDHMFG